MKFKCVGIREWGEDGLQVEFRYIQEAGEGSPDSPREAEETASFSHNARGSRKDAVSKYEIGKVYEILPKVVGK